MKFIENSWIFDEYSKVFKGYVPPIFAQEQMLVYIEDAAAWQKTCFDWAMNDYKPSSVGKMIDYYNQRIQEQLNGTNQPNNNGRNPGKATSTERLRDQSTIAAKYPTEAEVAAGYYS